MRTIGQDLVRGAALASVSLGITLGAATAPVRAELPSLIPRAALFGNPKYDWPQISPDGKRLAYLAPSEAGVVNVWVRTLGSTDDVMITDDRREGIGLYKWAQNGRHLLYSQDRDGDENLHLWSIELETRVVRDLTPFQGVRAQTLLTSVAKPNEVLVGLNLRDKRVFDMYRIDLETGACKLDTQNPGDVMGWTADANFVLRAANKFDAADGSSTICVRDNAEAPWRDLLKTPFFETPLLGQSNGGSTVLGFAPGGRALYLVTWRDSDTTRLVKVDATSGRELGTLAHDPRSDVWALFESDAIVRYQVMLHPKTQAIQAVAFEDMKVEWLALEPLVERDFETIRRAAGAASFFVLSRDTEDRVWIVATAKPDAPMSFHHYDRATGRLQHLFDDRPEIGQYSLAPVEIRRIRARDGLMLPSYLTLPVGIPAKKLPLVLFVHGGPWHRDEWFYDPTVQWLANRGYAVLQVQFRGSTGFGKKFLNAATGQWGVGSMQHDLTDAVRWAIDEGIADPKRVAIMGGSYGGYATLAGLAFTPELYACGVDVVGPSNVATALAATPAYWVPVKKRWIMRVGDVEKDAALNERISPLHHVEAIRAPLLIAHGTNDPRVKLSESEQMVAALRERGLPVTFVVYPDEGHGFARPQNALDFSGRTEEFLARHLGGRVEPWQTVEGSSATTP